MGTYTTNLSLNKPDQDDFFDIADFNENFDSIDTAINSKLNKATGTIHSGDFVSFTSSGDIVDSGKKASDFMSVSANYVTVGADAAGSAQAVRNTLTTHTADATKHFTSAERTKLSKAYTTDNIVVSSSQPSVKEGRIWIKVV